MPVYNAGPCLEAALSSIERQTLSDWELIAIDDGSNDGSGDLLDLHARKESRIRVIHQENRGLGPSLRLACETARGKYWARMDADDLSFPARLKSQLEYLEETPKVGLLGTWYWVFDQRLGPYEEVRGKDWDAALRRMLSRGQNPFCHGTVMMRGELYKELAGYRFHKFGEELDLWLQLSEVTKLGMLESVQYLFRRSLDGVSFTQAPRQKRIQEAVLILAEERRRLGREVSDWRKLEEKALGSSAATSISTRMWIAGYSEGLLALRRGDYGLFLQKMEEVGRTGGIWGKKARRLHRLRCFAPFFRFVLTARLQEPWALQKRSLREGTPLPDWSKSLLLASRNDSPTLSPALGSSIRTPLNTGPCCNEP
jgi:glycosyltransferase involved in cell wall biosynthesis